MPLTTGYDSRDFRVLFDWMFDPVDRDELGRAITATARRVWELQTHAAYVAWFKEAFPPLFSLVK